MDSIEKKIASITTSSAKTEEKHEDKEKHEHWKADEITKISDNCPECKAEKEKLKEAFGKPYLEEHWREKLPIVCENCGEGVLVEEENCPKCRGTKAKKRA